MKKINTLPISDIEQLAGDFLEYMQVERGVSPLTLRDYRHYLSRFIAWYTQNHQTHGIESINLDSIRKYRVYLSSIGLTDPSVRSLKRVTQNYHVIALRAFFKWLLKNDKQVLAPEKIELPKAESRSLKFLEEEHLEKLLSAPQLDSPAGIRDRAILELLFSTGLRVSELTKLDRENINLERREFGVIGKGGRARVVFLSQRAVDWINSYLGTRSDTFKALFVSYRGKSTGPSATRRLTPRSVQRLVEKYVKSAQIPIKITPHGLRHTFATDLLRAGADIRSVQEMLGHKNIATTQIYTHVTNKQLREIHEQFHGKGK